MSLTSQKFQIVSVDAQPLAHAALGIDLGITDGSTGVQGIALDGEGTPVTGSTSIPTGSIVTLNQYGVAALATTGDIGTRTNAKLAAVVLRGNDDYDGKYVQKITALVGGCTFRTAQFIDETSLPPGAPVTFATGKVALLGGTNAASASGTTAVAQGQIIGFIGPNGKNTAQGWLEVVMPQGGVPT